MTSWAAVSVIEVLNRIVNFDIFCENGKLKPKADPIWKEICQIWRLKSGSYLKTPITFENEKISTISDESKENISTDDSDFNVYQQTKRSSRTKLINFALSFSNDQWLKIKPIKKIDRNKQEYFALRSGWGHIIAELVYVSQKLPCAYNFKTHNIYKVDTDGVKDKFIIKINGFCTEKICKSGFYGEINFTFDDDDNVSIIVHTLDTKNIPHTKKRHVSGNLRKQYGEAMELKKSEVFKNNLIDKFQEYGDQHAPIIPKTGVLNQIRHQAKKKRFGIEGDLWHSIQNLKHNSPELSSVIRQVGYSKFFAMYWTPEQISVYNDLLTFNPIVSIDATGGVVRKITYNDKSYCGPIFLYQVVTHIGSLIVPVCQMLSERHDTTIIEFWLRNWISSKAHEPLEIVTDMSKALQNAICMAYNHDTYRDEIKNSTTCEDKISYEKHLSCHEDDKKVIDEPENKIQTNDDLTNYVEDLFKKVPISSPDESIRFDDVNMYHLPAITKDLQLLFNKFPSWTNAMVRYYKSENYVATSSRSENYFRFIKDNVLTDRQTNRADLFIAEHTKSINTKMIEAKSYYNNEKLTRKKPDLKKDKKKMDSHVLNFVENWKNRVIVDNSSEVDLTENEQSENDSKSCDCDDTKEDTNFIQDFATREMVPHLNIIKKG
ncbi:120.7 kDa protein in NOF-FB transposable element [Cotesia typhae]|uniref:120.7 kDa protein in NOF-FB transposable element n=1 Tax=Cotesia typhae TaxID=2053667 RepID=UPI003D68E65A